MLDNFRRTDLIIDKATQRIDWQTPMRVVQGEYNGRSLRVQLTNNGIVEAQTAKLLFGFYCASNHTEGVYDMPVVDAGKGLYEVFYPSEMLKEPGMVACTIKIIENTGSGGQESHITILDGISVEVAKNPVSGEAEVPENSIRVFDKALIDIAAHERRILLMELNFEELAKMLTLNIPNMDVAVSTRASQESLNALDPLVKHISDYGAKEATAQQIANAISALSQRGMVKSVQKGTYKHDGSRSYNVEVIKTSPVGEKNIIFVNGYTIPGGGSKSPGSVISHDNTTGDLVLTPGGVCADLYWQIIEFY